MNSMGEQLAIGALIAAQWAAQRCWLLFCRLGGWVWGQARQRPRGSSMAAAVTLLLFLPGAQAQSPQPTPYADATGERLALRGAQPDARGWWHRDEARLSSAWMALLDRAHRRGWQGRVNSGIRTHAEQAHLYQLFLAGEGAPAFPADGPSRHLEAHVRARGGWYQAVDVTQPQALVRVARRLGVELNAPYADEPWHLEASHPFRAAELK